MPRIGNKPPSRTKTEKPKAPAKKEKAPEKSKPTPKKQDSGWNPKPGKKPLE